MIVVNYFGIWNYYAVYTGIKAEKSSSEEDLIT